MSFFTYFAFFIGIAGTVALCVAFIYSRWIRKQACGSERLQLISGHISDGARAFLSREYRTIIPFVILVAFFLLIINKGNLRYQAVSFVIGAICSALAGFIGMRIATAANSRTTEAALSGLNPALKIAFRGGSVMGLSVAGLTIIGISTVFLLMTRLVGSDIESLSNKVMPIVSGFSLGASSIALFARIGGGIYTKAADVGADLVGKVEAGIPEDDPRNPAVIADNVGDNVGDVAGMGADLLESFAGSIIGSMILGLSLQSSDSLKVRLVLLPLILASAGVFASILGIILVRTGKNGSPQKALNKGTTVAAIAMIVMAIPIFRLVLGVERIDGGVNSWRLYGATLVGLGAGYLIGVITEYFTGTGTRPVRAIVKSCETGSATTLISGMGVGMMSAFPPVLVIAVAIISSHGLAGLYGVSIAALGMLLTIGIHLAIDAYGPIADNAGGLAVMSEYPREVREITDKLDAVGNTTAAIGKGFAIGSAAMTALILLNSFKAIVGNPRIDLTSVPTMVGLIIGAVIPYLFSSLALTAVGRAAFRMIEEVRRQFAEKPGIISNNEEPDYRRCIDISTGAALKEMILPGLIATVIPVLAGFLGGISMLFGILTGVMISGIVLALFMSNSGGAWDNAKKMVEAGEAGGKGSEAYNSAVVGDTVGDPFKDTAGPSLNILIKLMVIVSLVIAPALKSFWS